MLACFPEFLPTLSLSFSSNSSWRFEFPPFPSTNTAHGALCSPYHHPSCPPPYLALPLTHLPQFTPFSRYLASDCPPGPRRTPGKHPTFLLCIFLFCLLRCGQTVFVFALQEHQYTPFPPLPTPLGVWVVGLNFFDEIVPRTQRL